MTSDSAGQRRLAIEDICAAGSSAVVATVSLIKKMRGEGAPVFTAFGRTGPTPVPDPEVDTSVEAAALQVHVTRLGWCNLVLTADRTARAVVSRG